MVKKKKDASTDLPKQNTMPQLEIKKMRQGMSYSGKEKTIILNVFKYFRNQYPEKCVTEIVRRTATATGCSEKSVFQFRKEEASAEGFKEPSKTKVRKNININSRDIKYDNTVRSTIRSIIYDLQYKNIVPSLNTILKQINANKEMPSFSLMTLRRLMFDMGFFYQKNGNKSVLVESPDSRLANVQSSAELNNQSQLKQMPPPAGAAMMNPQSIGIMQPVNKAPVSMPPPPPPPDPRISSAMHIPAAPAVPTQHDPAIMPAAPEMMHAHPHMLHKSMPMMVDTRRDMMVPPPPPPPLPPPIDMHRKRDPMAPWMHGIIKQGQ